MNKEISINILCKGSHPFAPSQPIEACFHATVCKNMKNENLAYPHTCKPKKPTREFLFHAKGNACNDYFECGKCGKTVFHQSNHKMSFQATDPLASHTIFLRNHSNNS